MTSKQKSKTTEMLVTRKPLITSITLKDKEEKDLQCSLNKAFHPNKKKTNNLSK